MQLKCTKEFFDKKNNVKRNVGEIFEATEERAEEIKNYQTTTGRTYVEEVQEQQVEETPEQTTEGAAEQQVEDNASKAARRTRKAAGEVINE